VNGVQVYSKDVSGVVQLHARASDGTISQLTGGGGGGAGESAATVFTFRPSSGETGPLVWDDFESLYAALDTLRSTNLNSGKYRIVFDDQSVGGPGNVVLAQTTSPNVTMDFSDIELVGVHQDQNVLANFADSGGEGTSFVINNALWFEGLTVRSAGQDTTFVALADQTITLKRTTFNGQGQYVYDFLGVSGCVVHMDDESRMQRTSNAAMRVNTNALTVHVTGNNCVIDNLGIAGFVGGSIVVDIFSSSAQVDPQQDILNQTFNMRAASGFWSADPNGDLVAERGVLVSDENTGTVWRNTDGGTTWAAFGAGSAASGIFVWAVGMTWATVYATVNDGKPWIVLVQRDVAFRQITKELVGPTNLWNLQLVGMGQAFNDIGVVEVRTQSGLQIGLDYFGFARMQIKNLDFQFECGSGAAANAVPLSISVDGGRLNHNQNTAFTNISQCRLEILNDARVIGTGGVSLVELVGATSNQVWMGHNAELMSLVFRGTGGPWAVTIHTRGHFTNVQSPQGAGVTLAYDSQMHLISPNGTQWTLSVDNAGTLVVS
jgi:hypothetical protein